MRTLPLVVLVALAACDPPETAAPATAPTARAPEPPKSAPAATFAYPPAKQVTASDSFGSRSVPDPYRWLEDGNAADVQAFVKAEDDLAKGALDALPERKGFEDRLAQIFTIDELGPPIAEGKRTFSRRREGGADKSVLFVQDDAKAARRPLLDPNGWKTTPPTALHATWISRDGQKIAYEKAPNNADEIEVEVMEVSTGKVLERLGNLMEPSIAWSAKGDAFFYAWVPPDPTLPEAERFAKMEIRRHVLGRKPEADEKVRPALGHPGDYQWPAESRDGHWLLVHEERGTKRQWVQLRRADRPSDPWVTLADGDVKATAVAFRDVLYVMTNDGAPRFKLTRLDAAKASTKAFTTIVPERADATLDEFRIVGGKLVLLWNVDAAHELEVADLDGQNRKKVALPELGSVASLSGREDEPAAHFLFSSFARPAEIWKLDVAAAAATLVEKPKAALDPSLYVTERIFATSKDGTKVPAFVVRRKDTPKDGARPTILYAYGGFSISQTPGFRNNAVAWMDQGGVYVLAALRGGGEYGESWHQAGMLTKKQNVFDDYYAVAEALVAGGYTKPKKLVALGGSNGGLLVGVAVTQRPDLWGAAVSLVPLMDMVRMRSSGNGASWVVEYGSPDVPAELDALLGYSPYHNVKPGVIYPPTLVKSSDADARVDPMHARKFVARMQAAGGGGPVYLRTEEAAGHGGADGVKKAVARAADLLAFARHHTGG